MRILLVNPPNCGRSIPEERYGIDSLKQIFRGEPLALETLAGNLHGHEVRIVDLKVEPEALPDELAGFAPELVGFTAMTCEANSVLRLARQVKENCNARVVVGGVHASNDPQFFNRPEIDFVVVGLGKQSLRQLVDTLETAGDSAAIPGIAATAPGRALTWPARSYSRQDLVQERPPAYGLVERYRPHYTLQSLGLEMGFVASAFGCPFDCSFCCIAPVTGGRYLTAGIDTILRDIGQLEQTPVIRLVDANTFGNPQHARRLAEAIRAAGIRKHFLADVRSDTVVRHPELLRLWKEIGLRAVVIGFEEVSDVALDGLNKANSAAVNSEAIRILHQIGLTIVGDFIISPDYDEAQFDALEAYVADNPVDLPMYTVLTPLPGTPLYAGMRERITIHDLDYYTLTNAVVPTRLEERIFYQRYAALLKAGHAHAKL
ncbi:B12-binding domain-containing radical SAM protein [Desulfuromonas versatilis]|uniref:B12-binding domain-containing radical SAM protein n=1 Tax=Desulfuromonas versatilis TaxID=2802975 RepID=A0ABN6DSQ1_9BACT|nr:cobalamin-dependent protein [Desulfuromonas versatilis]BCR03212.1 B12-binding domain-containing radical SAM protein [Desulfuromonas versatilis]